MKKMQKEYQMDVEFAPKMSKYLINEIYPRIEKNKLTFIDIAPWNYLITSFIILECCGVITRYETRKWLDELFSKDSIKELNRDKR